MFGFVPVVVPGAQEVGVLLATLDTVGPAEGGPDWEDSVLPWLGQCLRVALLVVIIIVVVPCVCFDGGGQELRTLAPVDAGTLTESSVQKRGLM